MRQGRPEMRAPWKRASASIASSIVWDVRQPTNRHCPEVRPSSYLELYEGSGNVLLVEADLDPALADFCEFVLDLVRKLSSSASAIQAGRQVSKYHRVYVQCTDLATKMHAAGEKIACAFSAVTKTPLNQVCSEGGAWLTAEVSSVLTAS